MARKLRVEFEGAIYHVMNRERIYGPGEDERIHTDSSRYNYVRDRAFRVSGVGIVRAASGHLPVEFTRTAGRIIVTQIGAQNSK